MCPVLCELSLPVHQANTLNILIRLSATLFSSTLSRQSLLHSPPLAGLQVIGVALYVPNDVLRLNLALEVSEQPTAALLGVSVALLRKWRRVGGGPPYLRIGKL